VAVLALRSGKVYGEKLFIDKNFLKEEAIDVMSMKHIQEKTGNFELDNISDIIQEYQESDFLKKNQEKIFHRKNWNSLKVFTKSSEVKSQKPLRIKVIRFVLYRLGFLIEQVGIRIKNI
jgi:hypothetical protein